ncbi:MAG: hypothetical protein WDO71_05695 [Bacteroidota bacterium]
MIDGRMKKMDGKTPQYNDKNWSGVVTADHPKDILIATYNEPIKKPGNFSRYKINNHTCRRKSIGFWAEPGGMGSGKSQRKCR